MFYRKYCPGIMITDFTTHSLINDSIELSEKTKKVYNILGDTPEAVAEFLVNKIIKDKKNNVKTNWLTNRKAFLKFLTAMLKKVFLNKRQYVIYNKSKARKDVYEF